MAASLVQADLWGHQSHGVLRASWYFERLRTQVMQAVTEPIHIVDRESVMVLDGQDGVGQVLAALAMNEAITRAKRNGVATVTVRNANHFGTVMYYTKLAADAGCVAFMTCNGGPAMAPWGGYRDKVVGTNPWSIAAPLRDKPPMILDIANTGVARGKIYLAKQKHESIPEGWALNARGEPTTDPADAIAGIILPMAGHKGYGIGVMMDVFAGVLSGSRYLTDVNGPYHYDRKSGAGFFITVYDLEAFMPADEYYARTDDFLQKLKNVPLAQGVEKIYYPGELEAERDELHRSTGLQLPADTLTDLERIAGIAGLSSKLPF
ncbi:lactate dehydrogenase [Pseudomonas matsuisoli]|uniref:Lactate dehydrogenase n=2 Tax=Pseudomonas matsuisoli TaxID=1515666 RepID=A0A917UUP1_9PSED|nr:lactate dehydrogenase [Pseudomonas matsuisoli]